jgi:sporulation protein YlmC with PRC-barrel domain
MRGRMLIGFIFVLTIIFGTSIGTSLAQKETGGKGANPGKGAITYEPAKGERVNAFMVERIIGSKVRNMKGEDLGTIKDVVVDIDTGQILYAIMDTGGFLGIAGKLFPVPWQSLAPLPSEDLFFLDVSKAKLKNAPSYDKNSLPDIGNLHWGRKVAEFYKASRDERSYEYGYGYGYGAALWLYPGIAQEDPFAEIFDPQSVKEINGEVIKVEHVIPQAGIVAQMEVKLIVLINRKEPVPVFLGPQWFVARPDRRLPFKSGDKIMVKGSWITSQTEPFMIATMVREGTQTFQLRHPDGTPIWSGLKMRKELMEGVIHAKKGYGK